MRNKVDFSELERTRNHGDTLKLGTRPTATGIWAAVTSRSVTIFAEAWKSAQEAS